jgi:hypothetical protein
MRCLCRRPLLAGLVATALPAAAQSPPDHAALLSALRRAGALDTYAAEALAGMVAALGRALRLPATLNLPPPSGGAMVVLLKAQRERRGVPQALGVPAGLIASPAADPARRLVWLDADFLRVLAMRIALLAPVNLRGAGLSGVQAVTESELAPPPARPELWEEDRAPVFHQPTQEIIARGAAGFVLAHEMAHLLGGPAPPLPSTRPDLPRRARQLAPACPQLTDPAIAARRAYEEQADTVALNAVLAAGEPMGQGRRGLPGELGIATLLTLTLAANIVQLGSTIESGIAPRGLQMMVGPEKFAALRARNTPVPGTDLTRLVYSDTHPAAVQRLMTVMRALAAQRGSLWFGDPDPASDQAVLLQLQELACADALRAAPAR